MPHTPAAPYVERGVDGTSTKIWSNVVLGGLLGRDLLLDATIMMSRLPGAARMSDAGAGGSIFKVIKASVESHFHISVTRQMTAEIGNKVTSPIRAHHALVGKYGVFRMVVTGHLYYWTRYCSVGTDKGYVTAQLPDQVGWRVTEPHL